MSDDAATVVTCPFCAEEIRAHAVKCKHCHEAVPKPRDKGKSKGNKNGNGEKDRIVLSLYPVWYAFARHIFLGILLLPLFGIGLIVLIRTILRRYSIKYVLMTKKIIVQKGFVTRTTQSFNLNKISSMSFSQSPMQRILKSGDVLLTLPGVKISVENVRNPQKFVETISKYK